MHPLIGTMAELKDSEIEAKIQELTRKFWLSRDVDMRYQIQVVLETYNAELSERRARIWQKQQDEMDNALGKLINID